MPKVKKIKGFKIMFNIGFMVTLIIEISKTKRTSFGVLVVTSMAGNKYLQTCTPRKLNIEITIIFRSKLNIFCIFSILAKIWQKVKGIETSGIKIAIKDLFFRVVLASNATYNIIEFLHYFGTTVIFKHIILTICPKNINFFSIVI